MTNTEIMVQKLREVVEKARKEQMTYAEVVGCLEMVKHEVIDEGKDA